MGISIFKEYEDLIDFAKNQDRKKSKGLYLERHHIIPKSMGGDDSKNNLVLLTLQEHVMAHYLLALKYENVNIQWYSSNICAAWLVFHGKSVFSDRKREEIEAWLKSPESQMITLKLKEKLKNIKYPNRKKTDVYENEHRIWVQYRTQRPLRILERNRNTPYHKKFFQISDCPICHCSNSDKSFACCGEHEKEYLNQMKFEYKSLKSSQTAESWKRPEDRKLRMSYTGKRGPKQKHI